MESKIITFTADEKTLGILEVIMGRSIDSESRSFIINLIIWNYNHENPDFKVDKIRSSFMSIFHRLCHERLGISLNDFYHKHNIIESGFMQFAKRSSEGRGMYGMGNSYPGSKHRDTQEEKDFLYKTRTALWNNIVKEELGFDIENWRMVVPEEAEE